MTSPAHGVLHKGASVEFVVETVEDGSPEPPQSAATRCKLFTRQVKRCLICSSYGAVVCPIGVCAAVPPVVALLLRCIFCECFCGAPKLPPVAPDLNGPKLFFDGAGWAFSFNMGVAQYLMQRYDLRRSPLYAISAGNFAAICILFNTDPEGLLNEHFGAILDAMLARPMCGFCDNLAPVAAFLHTWLPDNAHEVASGRLHVAVSSWPMLGMRFLSKFQSKGELVDAIVASCFFPGFVARPRFSCHGTWTGTWFDAGLQNMATPIDYRMDLPVRAFPVPVCASCVAAAMPCYYGPPPVSSLGPTGDAVHPGHVPVDLAKALDLMRHAHNDAARFLADNPRPWVKDLIARDVEAPVAAEDRGVSSMPEMNRV